MLKYDIERRHAQGATDQHPQAFSYPGNVRGRYLFPTLRPAQHLSSGKHPRLMLGLATLSWVLTAFCYKRLQVPLHLHESGHV